MMAVLCFSCNSDVVVGGGEQRRCPRHHHQGSTQNGIGGKIGKLRQYFFAGPSRATTPEAANCLLFFLVESLKLTTGLLSYLRE